MKENGYVFIVVILLLAVLGGLGGWYYLQTYSDSLTPLPASTPTETPTPIVVQNYSQYFNSEFELASEIPVLEELTKESEYHGVNIFGQNIHRYGFNSFDDIGKGMVQGGEEYRDSLKVEGWEIKSFETNTCGEDDDGNCAEWVNMTASKGNKELWGSFGVVDSVIEVRVGEEKATQLALPHEFLANAVTDEMEVTKVLKGTDSDGDKEYYLEFSNWPSVAEHSNFMKNNGWDNCAYGSASPGAASYGCGNESGGVRVNFIRKQAEIHYPPRDKFLTFPESYFELHN